MRGQNDARIAQLTDHFEEGSAGDGIYAGGRLIEELEFRTEQKRQGAAQFTLVTTRAQP